MLGTTYERECPEGVAPLSARGPSGVVAYGQPPYGGLACATFATSHARAFCNFDDSARALPEPHLLWWVTFALQCVCKPTPGLARRTDFRFARKLAGISKRWFSWRHRSVFADRGADRAFPHVDHEADWLSRSEPAQLAAALALTAAVNACSSQL